MAAETLRDVIRHGAEAYGEQTAFRYKVKKEIIDKTYNCLLYTSPSPRDA